MTRLVYGFLFSLSVLMSLEAVDNTPWLLPLYEPEATFGVEQPLRRTSSEGLPFFLVKACGAFSEKSELGLTAYSRPLSCSLSYERQLTNDLDQNPFASSFFLQGGNALPWNGGLEHREPFSLLGGGRIGCHYSMKGESYGQCFLSVGLLGKRERHIQKVGQIGINYAFDRQHKVQMEAWKLFDRRRASDAVIACMLTYTYVRENQSQILLGGSLRKTRGCGGWIPFLTLSYSIPISLDAF